MISNVRLELTSCSSATYERYAHVLFSDITMPCSERGCLSSGESHHALTASSKRHRPTDASVVSTTYRNEVGSQPLDLMKPFMRFTPFLAGFRILDPLRRLSMGAPVQQKANCSCTHIVGVDSSPSPMLPARVNEKYEKRYRGRLFLMNKERRCSFLRYYEQRKRMSVEDVRYCEISWSLGTKFNPINSTRKRRPKIILKLCSIIYSPVIYIKIPQKRISLYSVITLGAVQSICRSQEVMTR